MSMRAMGYLIGSTALGLGMGASAIDMGSIVAYWPADEGRGETAKGVVGGLDGTLVFGPAHKGTPHDEGWADGQYDTSGLAFDAAKQWFVEIGTSEKMDQLGAADTDSAVFTVAYWIKSGLMGGKGRTVDKGSVGWTQGWHCALVTGRVFSEAVDASPPGWQLFGGTTVADNEWHHVAHVFNTIGESKIYVDGTLDGSADTSGDADIAGREWPLAFGALASVEGGGHEYLSGVMDEVAIFSGELGEGDLEDLMDAPIGDSLSVDPAGKVGATWAGLKAAY